MWIPRLRLALALLVAFGPRGARHVPARFIFSRKSEACAERSPLRRLFFGDTHIHTAFSQDASTQGTRNLPRGERLGIQPKAQALALV